MEAAEMQNWLIFANLAITTIVTIFLQIKSNNNNKKDTLDQQLIEIQRISFYDPFVEDIQFTNRWDELKENYLKGKLDEETKKQFLKYDVYTEMIFNFLYNSYEFYKKEKKLLNYVTFKEWLNTHKRCWLNPLCEHINRESYGRELYYMVEDWLK